MKKSFLTLSVLSFFFISGFVKAGETRVVYQTQCFADGGKFINMIEAEQREGESEPWIHTTFGYNFKLNFDSDNETSINGVVQTEKYSGFECDYVIEGNILDAVVFNRGKMDCHSNAMAEQVLPSMFKDIQRLQYGNDDHGTYFYFEEEGSHFKKAFCGEEKDDAEIRYYYK